MTTTRLVRRNGISQWPRGLKDLYTTQLKVLLMARIDCASLVARWLSGAICTYGHSSHHSPTHSVRRVKPRIEIIFCRQAYFYAVITTTMKLLPLNLLNCARKSCKSSPAAFPLHPQEAELERIEIELNPPFITNILPRLEWDAMKTVSQEVRKACQKHSPGY